MRTTVKGNRRANSPIFFRYSFKIIKFIEIRANELLRVPDISFIRYITVDYDTPVDTARPSWQTDIKTGLRVNRT